MDYNDKLRIAKEALASGSYDKETIEHIFPELKESEDEKIKKVVKDFVENYLFWEKNELTKEKALAWLEKQGEQRPVIVPKFMVGDFIRFKGNETLKGEAETHKIVSYDNESYVFDDGTTDLFCEQDLYELVEQKPAWSEEDESLRLRTIGALETCKTGSPTKCVDEQINWLKSLKDRVQPKQEWSEEDEDILNTIINHFEIDLECTKNDDIIKWLKSLRPQNRWKPSKEDMVALEHAINCYSSISPTNANEVYTLEIMKEQLKKLKG